MRTAASIVAVALLFATGAAMADASAAAVDGVAADAASTALALSVSDMVETNPLGLATIPLRLVLIEQAKSMDAEDGIVVLHSVSAASWGAAASNLLMVVGASAVALPIGLGTVLVLWSRGEEEREFYHLCRVHEELAGHPLTCHYEPTAH